MATLGKILDAQFDRMWQMLTEAILNTAEDTWREGFGTRRGLARLAYHIVETVDFYVGDTETEFPFGKRLGRDIWEAVIPDELPSKDQVAEYTDEVRERTEERFANTEDSTFLEPQQKFRWTGDTLLSRFIYVLKHCYYHFGHMNRIIRLKGNIPIDWR